MSSLDLFRELAPELAAVPDPTVTTWLTIAAKRHNATVFGEVYAEAMVLWTAHRISRLPGVGSGSGGEVGPVIAQADGDLSRTYGSVASLAASAADADLVTTRYGLAYLELRDSRAGIGPEHVLP